ALGVVGVEQAFWRGPVDHLGELPPQVQGVLDASVEPLAAHRGVHVRRVAGEQHAPVPVGRRLPRRVREPRDPGRVVHAVIGPVQGNERRAELTQGGLVAVADLLLAEHGAYALAAFQLAQAVGAELVATDAIRWLFGHFDLGDQIAGGRIPAGELDARRLADPAAASVAANQVLGSERAP